MCVCICSSISFSFLCFIYVNGPGSTFCLQLIYHIMIIVGLQCELFINPSIYQPHARLLNKESCLRENLQVFNLYNGTYCLSNISGCPSHFIIKKDLKIMKVRVLDCLPHCSIEDPLYKASLGNIIGSVSLSF